MLDLNVQKKSKISLSDYDYQKDIDNRLKMAEFTALDLQILEEILYSSIHISTFELASNLGIAEQKLQQSLQKFSNLGLLSQKENSIVVDKEMRKYFESQICKFDSDFKPGMDFIQGLLRKVPMHHLLAWYAIPRGSDNIFDSLVEKYLLTPQIYQKSLEELNQSSGPLKHILKDLFASPQLKIYSKDVMQKYKLSREQFEETMLLLEFHFACCLGYQKEGDAWLEVITPFQEWKEYLEFLQKTKPQPIEELVGDDPERPFAFVEDMTMLLAASKEESSFSTLKKSLSLPSEYFERLLQKALFMKFLSLDGDRLHLGASLNKWLDLDLASKAMTIYRHPTLHFTQWDVSASLIQDKLIREAEKNIYRIMHRDWVFLDDLIVGATAALSENSQIVLTKIGKTWRYKLPVYSHEETQLMRVAAKDWLYECGIVELGYYEDREIIRVTAFGLSLFQG